MKVLKYNKVGLENLQKAFISKIKAKVGILQENDNRDNSHVIQNEYSNNAEVGAKMEFGGEFGDYTVIKNGKSFYVPHLRVPPRSWLEMPLETKFVSQLGEFLLKNKKSIESELAKKGTKSEITKKTGNFAVEIIKEAFLTGGFGNWSGNHPLVQKAKGSNMPLIDTGQLMNAVSSKVVEE